MTRVIVTGGCGFIGSHLVERLVNKGYEVTVLDNFASGSVENLSGISNVQMRNIDISIEGSWDELFDGVKAVFHLAALADIVPSINEPSKYYRSNVTGTLNVMNAIRKHSVGKVIYAASSSCYGIPSVFPTPEDACIDCKYPYALTKRLGEEIVCHWCSVYGIDYTSLRLFNVYGPRVRSTGGYGAMFGVFLAQLANNQPLTVVGSGQQTRDFTFVTDVADAFLWSLSSEASSNQIFNVGSGQTYSVNSIVQLLGGSVVHVPERPGEPDCTFADISKIIKAGWRPFISIEKGVAMMLKDLAQWSDAPVWTPEKITEATADWFKYLGR